MSKTKESGALKQLETKNFEEFPEWRRQLMISADENDLPMLREHIEGYVNDARFQIRECLSEFAQMCVIRSVCVSVIIGVCVFLCIRNVCYKE